MAESAGDGVPVGTESEVIEERRHGGNAGWGDDFRVPARMAMQRSAGGEWRRVVQ